MDVREFKIRPLLPTDKERWLEFREDYLPYDKATLPPDQTDLTWNRLHDPHFDRSGLVAAADPRVIRITYHLFRPPIWAVNDYCYLEDLFVGRVRAPAADGTTYKRGESH